MEKEENFTQKTYDIKEIIQNAIDKRKKINLISYSMSDDIEKTIDIILENILEMAEKDDLKGTLYTIIKELSINGTKANQKRIFFNEHGYDIENPDEYKVGIQKYKEQFSEKHVLEYGKKAKTKGLFVKIAFEYDDTGMRIEITNNTPILKEEEKRIRERLAKVMTYTDMVQFYMDQADNTEGAGMGLALIIMLLKGEGIDPHLFRIDMKSKVTTAWIEIPFKEEFVSIREQYLSGSKLLNNENENN